jgi:hypothetical protein
MFDRLRSVLQAAKREFYAFDERKARQLRIVQETNLDLSMAALRNNTGVQTFNFVQRFLHKPEADGVATFLEAIEPLGIEYKLSLVQAAVLAEKTLMTTRPMQKWAYQNSGAIASIMRHPHTIEA